MGSSVKAKIGLNIKSLQKDSADSEVILPRRNTLEMSIGSPNHVKIIDSSNGYLPLWNLKIQDVKKTESNTFATPIKIGATSNNQVEEPLNPVLEHIPDAIYVPGSQITQPEPFVNSGYKWSQPNGKNTLTTITYSYSNLLGGRLSGGLTNSQITGIIREAVGLWSRYAPLNFVEVSDSGPDPSDASYVAGNSPQIRFGTHYIDGSNKVLAHAYYPYSTTDGLAGDIHFDSSETWKASPSGGFDLLEVAVHELGHALGLNHESTQTAIMNPYYGGRYSGSGSAFLFQDDINGIQDIYGKYSPLTMQRWTTRQGGFWDAQQWLVGDFNGDGKDDMAKAFNDAGLASIDTHLSNGSSFTMQRWTTRQGGFWDAQQWLVGDFNGDGKDDMAKAFNDAGLASIDVHLSSGDGFTMQRWATGQGGFWDAQQWLVGDFNGDGKDDMAKAFNDGGLASIDVHLSSGDGFTMQRWATGQGGFWDAQQWLVGDFNGNGKDDMAKAFNDGGLASIDVHTLI